MKDYKLYIKVNVNFFTTVLQSGNTKNEVEDKVRNVLNDIIKNQLINNQIISNIMDDPNELFVSFEIISEDVTKKSSN